MKDLSFFLLKNSFGAKMRKGFRNFCNGNGSTSTLNQQSSGALHHHHLPFADVVCLDGEGDGHDHQPTLEEMLFQLDMEEKMARRGKLDGCGGDNIVRHRMSCVNSSDILRSARNALNQYPRFSLDGKDAMYQSSFRNSSTDNVVNEIKVERSRYQLPSKIAGERVMWCKPGVVAKLMGLEAMPVPLRRSSRRPPPSREMMMNSNYGSDMMKIRRQNLRRRAEMERNERRDHMNGTSSSCSTTTIRNGYCVPKEMLETHAEVGWPIHGGFLYRNHNLV